MVNQPRKKSTPIRRGVGSNKADERRLLHEGKYPLDGGWEITEPEKEPQGNFFTRLLYGRQAKK
jgi:hypothetical protein